VDQSQNKVCPWQFYKISTSHHSAHLVKQEPEKYTRQSLERFPLNSFPDIDTFVLMIPKNHISQTGCNTSFDLLQMCTL